MLEKSNSNVIELLQCAARTTQYSYRRKGMLFNQRVREQHQICICYVCFHFPFPQSISDCEFLQYYIDMSYVFCILWKKIAILLDLSNIVKMTSARLQQVSGRAWKRSQETCWPVLYILTSKLTCFPVLEQCCDTYTFRGLSFVCCPNTENFLKRPEENITVASLPLVP